MSRAHLPPPYEVIIGTAREALARKHQWKKPVLAAAEPPIAHCEAVGTMSSSAKPVMMKLWMGEWREERCK